MTIPFWCLVATIVLAYVAKLPVVWSAVRSGGYDNHDHRAQQLRLNGIGKRAVSAHYNSLEAITFFAPAVFINYLTQSPPGISATLALLFVATRILFILFYLADRPTLRSASWISGFTVSLVLALLGAGT